MEIYREYKSKEELKQFKDDKIIPRVGDSYVYCYNFYPLPPYDISVIVRIDTRCIYRKTYNSWCPNGFFDTGIPIARLHNSIRRGNIYNYKRTKNGFIKALLKWKEIENSKSETG
jgi:hypothetical protein